MDTATPSSGAATTGPTTFSDPSLSWSEDSSSSTPSTDSTATASAGAATTEPPAASSEPEGQPQHQGAPPEQRWPSILENARKEAADKARAEYEQQYGWAKQVNQQQLQEAMQWYSRYNGNPIEFLNALSGELSQHPEWGPQLRSLAAKTLAARAQQAGTQSGPTLDQIQIDLGNGQTIALGDLKSQWLQEVRQELQPIAKTVEEVRAEREQLQMQAQARDFASGFMGQLSKLPGFNDHKAAIAQAIAAKQLTSDHPAEVRAAALEAYYEVVLPQLNSKAQSQLLDNLQQKAAASTSVNPGSAAPSTPKRPRSFHELGPEAWR